MIIFMINPFTFSFFAPVLDYFICEEHASQAHTISIVYSLLFIFLVGPTLIALVIYLDERSFKNIFGRNITAHPSDSDDHGLIVETMTTEGTAGKD
jgi:hypothetical protein